MSTGPAIGIDLGTTFSRVGVVKNGKVKIIANDMGNRTTPSCAAFTDRDRLIGEIAKKQADVNPTNTVFDMKRLIGRRFEAAEVQDDMRRWPFKVINAGEIPKIEVQYRGKTEHFVAEQISAMVLSKLKETAEAYLDEKVTSAVIAVPAYFNVNQPTVDAGKLAGLNVLRLINEPTAAAIAHGMDRRMNRQRNVLIFDWGGGTFDVSIMSIENEKFEVKAVGGDAHLGGEDITSRLVDHFVEIFREEHKGKDLTTNRKAISRLREKCEEAKKILSLAKSTHVEIVPLFDYIDFSASLTQARFEHLCSDLFSRTMDAVKTAMSDAKMTRADVDEILLVGGSTRIPKVEKMLQDFFGVKEAKRFINADEAVAHGAAVLAANLAGQNSAAMQDLVLLDVTPLSLIVNKVGGMASMVVKRNTLIPTKQTRGCQTAYDNQTAVAFKIFEGECAKMCDNHFLGKFTLSGFPPRPRGKTKFDLTYEIDENGILHVSAVERSTGKQNSITITNYRGRLSEKDIEQMLKDVEKFEQEDERERSRMAAKNELVDYVCSIKRKLEKAEVKENHRELLEICEDTIKWTDTENQATKEDYERMRKKFDSVYSRLMKSQ
uniref:Heat shock protein 70 n=1 Tax=Taenia asiatica TaxID=60517 RepID=A0A0R3WFA4_TAEAS